MYPPFLRMADERSQPRYLLARGAQAGNQPSPILGEYGWSRLLAKERDGLFDHYRHTVERLGHQKGLMGYTNSKPRTP